MFGHEDKGNEAEIASVLVKIEVFYEDSACPGIVEDRCEADYGRRNKEDTAMGFET